MKMRPLPLLHVLRGELSYDPDTGVLRWKTKHCGVNAGDVAGTPRRHGRRYVGVGRHQYAASRLAWKIYYGTDPNGRIDHRDLDPSNSSITNLRDVLRTENWRNRYMDSNMSSNDAAAVASSSAAAFFNRLR